MSRRHAVAALLAVVLVAGCGSQTVTEPPGTPTPSPTETPCEPPVDPTVPVTPTPDPEPTDPPAPTDPPVPTDPPTPDPTEPDEVQPTDPDPERLESGDRGPAVEALQTSLRDLGYWVGAVDGVYGANTRHAVVALQKSAGLQRDGIAGPATQGALADGIRLQPRSSDGLVLEISLAHQVVLVVQDGEVIWTLDTSTGKPSTPTPPGEYQITREIDGYRYAPLGVLYRPKYFHGGIAFHGYTSVPPYPASSACIRMTYPAMDMLWAGNYAPIGTPVWVY